MSSSDPVAPNALWSFAVERYARPGVREGCLALQDEAGLDVPFIFACAWLAQRGTPPEMAREALATALETTRTLRDEVLAPVRAARRTLKGFRDAAEAEAVREQLKRAELSVEALCFARIHGALEPAPVGARPLEPRTLLEVYLELEGLRLDAHAEQAFAAVAHALGK